VALPAGQSAVRDAPPGPAMVTEVAALASGRHNMTLAVSARHIVPPWVTSTCQIVVGLAGTMPALRTAPIRARRPSGAWTVRVAARTCWLGLKLPGPRKVRVPPAPSRTIVSPARRLMRALSGSDRPGG
jgi:hypothetical protein